MEPEAVRKKQSGGIPDVAQTLRDPFWFMRQMFGWGRSVEAPSLEPKKTEGAPSFDVKETDGAYVCKLKLTLPDMADVAHLKARLYQGELTIVVPKAAVGEDVPASPPPKTLQSKKAGRGSSPRTPRSGSPRRSRRG